MTEKSFEEICNLIIETSSKLDEFNEGLDNILGCDTRSMYYKPLEIVENFVINVLQNEFNESKEGAEWFVYEGLRQIMKDGTEIEDNGKKWSIKSTKDYYEYLVSLKNI